MFQVSYKPVFLFCSSKSPLSQNGKCIAGEMSDVFDFHGRVGNRTVDLQKKRKFPAVIEKKYFRSR